MKVILLATLFLFSLCEEVDGGWERSSIYTNSLEVEQSFVHAYDEYKKTNDVENSDLVRLTLYIQIVSGTNYKICFVDKKADFPTVQEYVYYKPLEVNTGGVEVYELIEHNEYVANNGLLDYNDEKFAKIEYELYKKMKKEGIKLNYISYAYLIENKDTNFYYINADTEKGEKNYILCQDKENKEFYIYRQV